MSFLGESKEALFRPRKVPVPAEGVTAINVQYLPRGVLVVLNGQIVTEEVDTSSGRQLVFQTPLSVTDRIVLLEFLGKGLIQTRGLETGDLIFTSSQTLPLGFMWANGALFNVAAYPKLASKLNGQYNKGDEPSDMQRLPSVADNPLRAIVKVSDSYTGTATLPSSFEDAARTAIESSLSAIAQVTAYLGQVEWWNGTREKMPIGFVAADGIMISEMVNPKLVATIKAGYQFAVTEAEWQADASKRSCWSLGGDGWVRVPDLNGFQAGSNPSAFLRGGKGSVGGISKDTMRKLEGSARTESSVGFVREDSSTPGVVDGVFKRGTLRTGYYVNGATGGRGNDLVFDSSGGLPEGHTGTEFAPWHAVGCWMVRAFGHVSNPGEVNVSQVADDFSKLDTRLNNFLESGAGHMFQIVPWNGPVEFIPRGLIPANGQKVYAATYPDAAAALLANKQFSVTEADWQAGVSGNADAYKGCWSQGGTDEVGRWFRVPKLNADTGYRAPFLRGSQIGVDAGKTTDDRIRDIKGDFGNVGGNSNRAYDLGFAGVSGAFAKKDTNGRDAGVISNTQAGNGGTFVVDFAASRVVPTGPENSPRYHGVVMCIRMFGTVSNPGALDAAQLATDLAAARAEISNKQDKGNNLVLLPTLTLTGQAVIEYEIPVTAKRVKLKVHELGTNGASGIVVRLGDTTGVHTADYRGAIAAMNNAAITGAAAATGIWVIASTASTVRYNGEVVIDLLGESSFVYTYAANMGRPDGLTILSSGSKALSGKLSKLRLTTFNGTDLFNTGIVGVTVE